MESLLTAYYAVEPVSRRPMRAYNAHCWPSKAPRSYRHTVADIRIAGGVANANTSHFLRYRSAGRKKG
jgi:hypothetical protein